MSRAVLIACAQGAAAAEVAVISLAGKRESPGVTQAPGSGRRVESEERVMALEQSWLIHSLCASGALVRSTSPLSTARK